MQVKAWPTFGDPCREEQRRNGKIPKKTDEGFLSAIDIVLIKSNVMSQPGRR